MNIPNDKWYDELRLVFLNILNKTSLYGNSVRLEGIILGELSLLGLLKGLEVIEVINYWKEYCKTIFKDEKYILSEIPPQYIIPYVDNNNQDMIIAQQQTYGWLSMKYMDYRTASLKQTHPSAQHNKLYLLDDSNIAFLENEIVKMINFEYFHELRYIPLFYGHFCSSVLGWLYYFRQLEYTSLFNPCYTYKTFSQASHAYPEFYNDYGTADPRNKEYENSVFTFYKNHGSLENYTSPFYWPTSFINNDLYKIIEKQILTCFVTLANKIEPELNIRYRDTDIDK